MPKLAKKNFNSYSQWAWTQLRRLRLQVFSWLLAFCIPNQIKIQLYLVILWCPYSIRFSYICFFSTANKAHKTHHLPDLMYFQDLVMSENLSWRKLAAKLSRKLHLKAEITSLDLKIFIKIIMRAKTQIL